MESFHINGMCMCMCVGVHVIQIIKFIKLCTLRHVWLLLAVNRCNTIGFFQTIITNNVMWIIITMYESNHYLLIM